MVEQAEHISKLTTCLDGMGECDGTGLAPWEKQATANARRDHNLENCLESVGNCDLSKLNDEERSEVTQVERRQNMQSCASGVGDCDHTLVNQEEKQEAAAPNLPSIGKRTNGAHSQPH
jgi:hypothetical protein